MPLRTESPCLSGHAAVQEGRHPNLPRDQRDDASSNASAPDSGASDAAQSKADWVVELLLPGIGESRVSGSEQSYPRSAASMAAGQAPMVGPGMPCLFGTASLSRVGPDRFGVANPPLPVGEGMTPCPRAGCGKSARPVR